MAIYHFHVGVIRRSKGQSAIASAAYRAGERLYDDRLGVAFDYARRRGVLHTEILTPENVPAWMRNRLELWNAVEKTEPRKDSQLARSVDISLMCELSFEKNLELLRTFVKEQWVNNGMVADIAIHAPGYDRDERNIHAHILLTMRELLPDGFGLKDRSWNRDAALLEWREAWANHANAMLEREGFNERIDHRSLKDQAIDREPTIHIGPSGLQIEHRGDQSDRAQQNRDIDTVNDNLDLLKQELAESETRLIQLRRQLATERMEQIQKTVRAADAVWEKAEARWPPSSEPEPPAPPQRLQPQGSEPPSHPEDSARPVSAGGKAPSMPDDLSETQKAAPAESLDKELLAAEQKRQDEALAAELTRQEQARRAQDELRDSLIAADERLKELGRIYREAQELREQLIKQSRELEAAHAAHEFQTEKQIHLEKPILQNPVETYLKERETAIEDRRQELLEKRDRGYLEGDIRDAGTRYAQALHHNYDFLNPFQSLAKCAIAEHASFRNDQDILSAEIAKTADPKAREALELRRKIEGYEYLMITGDRIAAQSEIITGRKNSDEAVRMRGLVHGKDIKDENGNKIGFEDGYKQKAQQLRQQYRDLQAERAAPQKELSIDELIKRQDEKQKAKEQQQKKEAPERQTQQQKDRDLQRDRDRER